jgi:glycosyltransferase involved in cell wall biosynthesis
MKNNLTYLFWQNGVSISFSSFIRALAEKRKVILIVDYTISDERIRHGWYVPELGKAKIIVAPNDKKIEELMGTKNAVHIVSGLLTYPTPSKALKYAAKKRIPVGLFMESFNWLGLKGKLRFIKYGLLQMMYGRHVIFIMTTGIRAKWCYEKAGFSKSKIFDWAYFTETPDVTIRENKTGKAKLLFIGSIDERKNILSTVEVCKKTNLIDQLTIIGVGPLENELKRAIENTNCQYIGKVPNKEIAQRLVEADLLILPSIYDGWGAVVNEALMCGVPVIASENCGSSILLNDIRGRVFSVEKNNLEEVLLNFVPLLPYSIEKRIGIRNWALQNISGEAAAKSFEEIIEYIFDGKGERPVAPWLKN